ncbi:MAG: alpha/beta hydrolase [Ignavibacteriaceae bacterium]|nr:alpha/beta hydrolase [Ignavibacteriaceae bacterium]
MNRLFKIIISLSLFTIFFTSFISAQTNEFEGTWNGMVDVGVVLPVVVHIKSINGKLAATLDSPDQNAYDIPVTEITTLGKKITVSVASIGAKFEGELSDDGKNISGTFTQGGGNIPLELLKTETDEKPKTETVYKSLWQGVLSISGMELRLVFKIYEAEGTLKVHLDSPDQGAKNIAGIVDYFNQDSVKFSFEAIKGWYAGNFSDETHLVGTWYQGPSELKLNLEKTEKEIVVNRPQEPKPPYPYKEEEVTFKNEKADITLAGTLTVPEGDEPFTAVVMVTGSGPQDRDENIFDHKLFKVIADYLTRSNIAVLRFDDRGVGKSEGDFSKAISTDFVSDAVSAVEYLSNRNDINSAKIGMMGHSEGGMIAPMAANESNKISYIVLLAGPGTTGEQILIDQSRLILKAAGTSDSYLDKQDIILPKIYSIVKSEKNDSIATEKIAALYDEFYAQLTDEEKSEMGMDLQSIKKQIPMILSPWFRYFIAYDPVPALSKLKIPVLALNGSKDLQVPADANLAGIESALKSSGNRDFKIVKLDGLNHLFQTAELGTPSEYGKIEETFSPKALEIIKDWILSVTSR